MKYILSTVALIGLVFSMMGCGESAAEKALDTAAPPPGPNANLNPPTKKNMPPPPPTAGGPGGAAPTTTK